MQKILSSFSQVQMRHYISEKLPGAQPDQAKEANILNINLRIIQNSNQQELNKRATLLSSINIYGDVVMVVERSYPKIQIHPGIYRDNNPLSGNKIDISYVYERQLDLFVESINSRSKQTIPFDHFVQHISRYLLKKSNAYSIYLRMNNQYYKKCLACLIVVMAMKKTIKEGDLVLQIIQILNTRLVTLHKALFFDYLANHITNLTSSQFTSEILQVSLNSSQILAQAIENRFFVKFTDPILRKIKSDCYYFRNLGLQNQLKPSHLHLGGVKNCQYFSPRERAYLMNSCDDLIDVRPPSLSQYQQQFGNTLNTIQESFNFDAQKTVAWLEQLELMFARTDPGVIVESLLYQCSFLLDDITQCSKIVKRILGLLNSLHQSIYSLNGFLMEHTQIDQSQQNYLLAMLMSHSLHGDPRGRGAINSEWEAFLCSRLLNLTSQVQDQDLLREILESTQAKEINVQRLGMAMREQLGWMEDGGGGMIRWSSENFKQFQNQAHHLSISQILERDYWSVSRAYGQILIWGFNSNGQIGTQNPPDTKLKFSVPRLLTALKDEIILQIACGHKHTLALNNRGAIYGWGSNDQGQCGQTTSMINVFTPTIINAPPMCHLSCGHDHSVALNARGLVYSWGAGEGGLLGQGDTVTNHEPTVIESLTDITDVRCGGLHTIAIDRAGRLFAWGRNEGAQLGLNMMSDFQATPMQIGLIGVKQVALGDAHSLALTQSGEVYGWGYCNAGQLGLGVCAESYQGGSYIYQEPTLIESLSLHRIIQIYAGSMFSLFLTERHELLTCGMNDKCQNGHESEDTKISNDIRSLSTVYNKKIVFAYTIPTLIQDFQGMPVLNIAAGQNHTLCQILGKGNRYKVYSWGINKHGQLGGGKQQHSAPQPILNLITYGMGAGGYHSCVIVGSTTPLIQQEQTPMEYDCQQQLEQL